MGAHIKAHTGFFQSLNFPDDSADIGAFLLLES